MVEERGIWAQQCSDLVEDKQRAVASLDNCSHLGPQPANVGRGLMLVVLEVQDQHGGGLRGCTVVDVHILAQRAFKGLHDLVANKYLII